MRLFDHKPCYMNKRWQRTPGSSQKICRVGFRNVRRIWHILGGTKAAAGRERTKSWGCQNSARFEFRAERCFISWVKWRSGPEPWYSEMKEQASLWEEGLPSSEPEEVGVTEELLAYIKGFLESKTFWAYSFCPSKFASATPLGVDCTVPSNLMNVCRYIPAYVITGDRKWLSDICKYSFLWSNGLMKIMKLCHRASK